MQIKTIYHLACSKVHPIRYRFVYLLMLLIALAADQSGMPWFALSMAADVTTLIACGATPGKTVAAMRQELSQPEHRLKRFVFGNNVLLFVIILPFTLKWLFY